LLVGTVIPNHGYTTLRYFDSFYSPAILVHIGHNHNQGSPRNAAEHILYMIEPVKDGGRKARKSPTSRGSTCSRNDTFSLRLQKDLASENRLSQASWQDRTDWE
jgi:hypothetical protein